MVFRIVNQMEIAYREFLGMNRIRLEPGVRLLIPFLHSIKSVDMREQQIKLKSGYAFCKDNVPVSFSSSVFYRPLDAEKMCFNINDINSSITAVCESANRATIGNFTYDEIICNRSLLTEKMKKVVGQSIIEWGVECTKMELTEFSPQNRDIAEQLERQMKAERARRENDLDTQAEVRRAEGQKQVDTLKSEGLASAIQNKADADAYMKRLEADVQRYTIEQTEKAVIEMKKYEVEQNAQALALQFKRLSDVIPIQDDLVAYLLSLEKLKQFQNLAKSNNKVFFMDSKEPLINPTLIEKLNK